MVGSVGDTCLKRIFTAAPPAVSEVTKAAADLRAKLADNTMGGGQRFDVARVPCLFVPCAYLLWSRLLASCSALHLIFVIVRHKCSSMIRCCLRKRATPSGTGEGRDEMALTPSETSNGLPSHADGTLDRALLGGRRAFLGFLAKRLGNLADAEDVLQDFCLRVLARKDQLRDLGRMDAWLYSILRSALNDFYRKSGRRERLGVAYAMEPGHAEVCADASETLARVCACVQGLMPQLRPADAELIRRVEIDDEDRKYVAADLGLSTATLAVRLHRARAALREILLGYCGSCCEEGFEDCSCPPAGCQDRAPGAHRGPEPLPA
jgi:RNA polymerase sigma factor (sigma-70 family)